MSNKIERTAWNLTKLAKEMDVRTGNNLACTCLYEIANDNKIAMIMGSDFGIATMVFIPSKVWMDALATYELYKDNMIESYAGACWAESEMAKNLVHHWYRMAMRHEF